MTLPMDTVFRSFKDSMIKKWARSNLGKILTEPEKLLNGNLSEMYYESMSNRGTFKVNSFFTEGFTETLKSLLEVLPGRRVCCPPKRDQWWTAYSLTEQTNVLKPVISLPPIKNFLFSGVQLSAEQWEGNLSWIDRFRIGQHEPRHYDASGSFHIMIGIQSPEAPEAEGQLVVEGSSVNVDQGDLFVFWPTQQWHYTTPVTQPEAEDKLVALHRFYVSNQTQSRVHFQGISCQD